MISISAIEKKTVSLSPSSFISLPMDLFMSSPAPRMQLTSAKVAPQGAGEAEEQAPRERPRSFVAEKRRRRCRDVDDAAEREETPAPAPPRPETLRARVSDEASRSIALTSRKKPWGAFPRSFGRAEWALSLFLFLFLSRRDEMREREKKKTKLSFTLFLLFALSPKKKEAFHPTKKRARSLLLLSFFLAAARLPLLRREADERVETKPAK